MRTEESSQHFKFKEFPAARKWSPNCDRAWSIILFDFFLRLEEWGTSSENPVKTGIYMQSGPKMQKFTSACDLRACEPQQITQV